MFARALITRAITLGYDWERSWRVDDEVKWTGEMPLGAAMSFANSEVLLTRRLLLIGMET